MKQATHAELKSVVEFLALIARIAMILAATWLLSAVAASIIARNRGGNRVHWVLLSLLLGPFAILLTLKLVRPCPHCQAKVLREVRTCPKCHKSIPKIQPQDNPMGPLWTYRRNW